MISALAIRSWLLYNSLQVLLMPAVAVLCVVGYSGVVLLMVFVMYSTEVITSTIHIASVMWMIIRNSGVRL